MKKIPVFFLVLTVFMTLFASTVSAAFYMEEDFSDGLPQFGFVTDPSEGEFDCRVEDGTLFLEKKDATGNFSRSIDWEGVVDSGSNLIMQFDLKWNSWSGLNDDMRIMVYIFGGDGKRILQSICPHKYWFNNGANTDMVLDDAMTDKGWYTFTYCFKKDRSVVDVYRQKTNSDEAPILLIGDLAVQEVNMTDQRFNIFMPNNGSAHFDNFRFFSGTYLEDGMFTMDGEKISKAEQISEGKLKAQATFVFSDVERDGEVMKAPEATLALVAYNKNGRMISCKYASNIELICGKQDVEIEVDTTTFRGSAEGGYVGFYIIDSLDGMQLLTNRIEL